VIHAIALNQGQVLPVSTQLSGEYGVRGVCMSVPTLVDRRGAARRYEIELWPKEQSALVASGRALETAWGQIR
jgi:L-lactate dehydrogenase